MDGLAVAHVTVLKLPLQINHSRKRRQLCRFAVRCVVFVVMKCRCYSRCSYVKQSAPVVIDTLSKPHIQLKTTLCTHGDPSTVDGSHDRRQSMPS